MKMSTNRRNTMPAKAVTDYQKPDDFLGGHDDTGRAQVSPKKNIGTNTSGLDKPDFFLGGCEASTKSKGPKMKMRASWVHTNDEPERSLQSLMLESVPGKKKPQDFLGGSVPAFSTRDHSNDDDEDKTKTTVSSSASDQKPEECHETAEPKPTQKVALPPKQEKEPSSFAKHGASAYANDGFLPGSEPKPIKKWTPPPKQDSDKKLVKNDITYETPSDFLGGSEPKPIKKWTPPPKRKESGQVDMTHDTAVEFIGGCAPKPIKKWTPPPKQDSEKKLVKNDITIETPTGFLGGCEPKPIKKWIPPPKNEESDKKLVKNDITYETPSDFLGGSEPKPIKKWTPPPKPKVTEQVDMTEDSAVEFIGGCAPKPIKKWTPPPKPKEAPQSDYDIKWDKPGGFLGGCDIPEARRWKPVSKEDATPAPWEIGMGRKPRTASIGHGNKSGRDRHNTRATWVAETVEKHEKHAALADDVEMSMEDLQDGHKEEKEKQTKTAKWAMSEPAMNVDDDDNGDEHMSYKQHISHFQKPNDFLGGSFSNVQSTPHKTKLRASWLVSKDDE